MLGVPVFHTYSTPYPSNTFYPRFYYLFLFYFCQFFYIFLYYHLPVKTTILRMYTFWERLSYYIFPGNEDFLDKMLGTGCSLWWSHYEVPHSDWYSVCHFVSVEHRTGIFIQFIYVHLIGAFPYIHQKPVSAHLAPHTPRVIYIGASLKSTKKYQPSCWNAHTIVGFIMIPDGTCRK